MASSNYNWLLHGVFVSRAGRYSSPSAESKNDAGKSEDTFIILAGWGYFPSNNFSHVPLYKGVPQLRLWLEMWAADGLRVLALHIPLGACFAQLVLDCIKVFFFEYVDQSIYARAVVGQVQNVVDGGGVGRHFHASYRYGVVTPNIVGIEL
ncbi:hypothetical protein V6N13_123231 [Hibiscus sabdariffa]